MVFPSFFKPMQRARFAAQEAADMRRLLIALTAFTLLWSPAKAADSTVTALTAASALTGSELFYCVQSAADRKCTGTQVLSLVIATANTWTATQTFGTVVGSVNAQAGTTYTLAPTDCGKTVVITNAGAITLTTLNSLAIGCAISVEQGGAGQITVANGAGATLTSAHSYTKTFNAAGAIIGLFVDTNAGGTAAHFVLTGDGA